MSEGSGGGRARRSTRSSRGKEPARATRASRREAEREEARRRKKGKAAAGAGGGSSSRAAREAKAGSKQREKGRGGPSRAVALKSRGYEAYRWLLETEPQAGSQYVPQLGDDVVYVPQAHATFLADTNNMKAARPWHQLAGMRVAEPCRVAGVEYGIEPDGQDSTVARLRLRLTGGGTQLEGREFVVDLPDMTGQAEFLVLQTRFATAERKGWAPGDRCAIYWPPSELGADDGKWWTGTVAEVVPAEEGWDGSPYNRLRVMYEDQSGDATEQHSMWELHPAEYALNNDGRTSAALRECVAAEAGCREGIPPDTVAALAARLTAVMQCEEFQAFREEIEPEEAFGDPPKVYVSEVPLPLALCTVLSRVRSGYYRQLEAVRDDVGTMLSNCVSFNGEGTPIADAAARLAERILEVVPEPSAHPAPELAGAYAEVTVPPTPPTTRSTRVRLRVR